MIVTRIAKTRFGYTIFQLRGHNVHITKKPFKTFDDAMQFSQEHLKKYNYKCRSAEKLQQTNSDSDIDFTWYKSEEVKNG